MAYFKIDNIDYSQYTNELKVGSEANYNAQTNAAGDTVVDYVNKKRVIEVGIIPLTPTYLSNLITAINKFNVSITFLNPETNSLETINCIIPSSNVEYYTIQANGKVMAKAFTLQFIEL